MPFVPVRRSGFAIAVLLATSAITARHPTATQQRSDQPTPLATVNMLVGGIERGDIDVVMRTFADDATVFFPGEPEKRATGTSEIRRGFAAVFARRRGVAPITPLDVQVQSFGDTAVVTAHLERPPGAPGTARRTFVLRRSGPSWLIVHLHASNVQGQ